MEDDTERAAFKARVKMANDSEVGRADAWVFAEGDVSPVVAEPKQLGRKRVHSSLIKVVAKKI